MRPNRQGNVQVIRPLLPGPRGDTRVHHSLSREQQHGAMAMEHWFDTLTRNVARQPRTRRSALGWAARLGIAATGVGLLGRFVPEAQASDMVAGAEAGVQSGVQTLAAAPVASSCSVEDTYGVLQSHFVTSATGVVPMTLTHSFIAEVGSGMTSSLLTIVPGAIAGATPRVDATMRMSVSTAPSRAASADAFFAAQFTGTTPRRVAFATDGQTLKGTVDGKSTAPAALGTDANNLRFPDGKPVIDSSAAPVGPSPSSPTTTPQRRTQNGTNENGSGNEQRISPPTGELSPAQVQAVQRAMSGLLRQAAQEATTCASRANSADPTARCTTCQLSCRSAWVSCSVSATQASLAAGALAPSVYLAAASGTCDSALQQCFRTCKSSGACCPSHCNGDANCCQSAWGCCRPGQASTSQTWSKAWPTCPRCGPPTR